MQFDPDAVAKVCDWPVNHCDLSARKKKLVKSENYLVENLIKDDKWFDAELAGYWICAASCWIGSGLTSIGQIPNISKNGTSIHSIAQASDDQASSDVRDPYKTSIYEWFRELSERLRYVRIVCGDWSRVCGGNWQGDLGVCGMYFDPPYGDTDRCNTVYRHDSNTESKLVEDFVLARGEDARYRIVVSGYDSEYQKLVDAGWRTETFSANGGYGNSGGSESRGAKNRHREVLFYSPHCGTGLAEGSDLQDSDFLKWD